MSTQHLFRRRVHCRPGNRSSRGLGRRQGSNALQAAPVQGLPRGVTCPERSPSLEAGTADWGKVRSLPAVAPWPPSPSTHGTGRSAADQEARSMPGWPVARPCSCPTNSLHPEVCLENRTVSPLLQHFTRPRYHIKGRKGQRGCPSPAAASRGLRWSGSLFWVLTRLSRAGLPPATRQGSAFPDEPSGLGNGRQSRTSKSPGDWHL